MTGRCPTCGGRRATWGPGAITDAFQAWNAAHGSPPVAADWRAATPAHPSSRTVILVFGTWNKGLRAAGFKAVKPGGRRHGEWDDPSMKQALFEWVFAHGRLPGYREWVRRDPQGARPTSQQAARMFGSWNAFIVGAGYVPVLSHRTRQGYSRQISAATRKREAAAA